MKSAYYEASRLLEFEEMARSSRSMVWKTVWTSKVAPKIKYFMWRMIHKCLPTKISLKEKGVQLYASCAVCGSQEETMEHVFFNCILSNVVWRNGFSGMQVQRDNNRDNMKFWEDVLEDTTRWTDD